MIPRLRVNFSINNIYIYWFGKLYEPQEKEYLLNHARSGIVMALHTALPNGGRVGVLAYNCHTVANAVVQSGCTPIFVDVTNDLHVDTTQLAMLDLQAIVVTNLFGIHNDIQQIRKTLPNTIIIVDNAHGYGLPAEGDFTVYSINQGKFPSLGEGGILIVNNPKYLTEINKQYIPLPKYSNAQEFKLFLTMWIKSFMHTPFLYKHITMRIKYSRNKTNCREKIMIYKMAKGVSRMYQYYIISVNNEIEQQLNNAARIQHKIELFPFVEEVWWGDNAFMAIARCVNIRATQKFLFQYRIETATHFAHAIDWAKQFGYIEGTCPTAERLTKELLMIPTYKKL